MSERERKKRKKEEGEGDLFLEYRTLIFFFFFFFFLDKLLELQNHFLVFSSFFFSQVSKSHSIADLSSPDHHIKTPYKSTIPKKSIRWNPIRFLKDFSKDFQFFFCFLFFFLFFACVERKKRKRKDERG